MAAKITKQELILCVGKLVSRKDRIMIRFLSKSTELELRIRKNKKDVK